MQAKEVPKEAPSPDDEEDEEEEPEGDEEDDDDEEDEPAEPPEDAPPVKRRPKGPSPQERRAPRAPAPDPSRPSNAPTYANIDTRDMIQLNDMEVGDAELLFQQGKTYSEVLDVLCEKRLERGEEPLPRNRYTRDQLKAVLNRAVPGINRGASLSGLGAAQNPAAAQSAQPADPLAPMKQVAAVMDLARKITGGDGDDIERTIVALQKRGLIGTGQKGDPELEFLGKLSTELIDFGRDVAGKPKRNAAQYSQAMARFSAQNAGRRPRPAIQGQAASIPALPPGAPEGPQGNQANPAPVAQPSQAAPEGPQADPDGWAAIQDTDWVDYLDRLAHEKVFPFILDAQAGTPKEETLKHAFQNGTITAAASWALASDRRKPHIWDEKSCLRCDAPKTTQAYSQPCPKSLSDREKLRRLAPETPKTLFDRVLALKVTIQANLPIPEFGNRTLWQRYVEDPVPELANLTVFKVVFSEQGLQWMAGFLEKLKEEAAREAARALPSGPAQPAPPVPPGAVPIPQHIPPGGPAEPVRLHPSQMPKPQIEAPKTEEKKG